MNYSDVKKWLGDLKISLQKGTKNVMVILKNGADLWGWCFVYLGYIIIIVYLTEIMVKIYFFSDIICNVWINTGFHVNNSILYHFDFDFFHQLII